MSSDFSENNVISLCDYRRKIQEENKIKIAEEEQVDVSNLIDALFSYFFDVFEENNKSLYFVMLDAENKRSDK